MYFVYLQVGRVWRKRECSISILWRKRSTIFHWLMGVCSCACVDNHQSKTQLDMQKKHCVRIKRFGFRHHQVAKPTCCIKRCGKYLGVGLHRMVMWARHRWQSWYGNDSNMWMVLLLNVIETIFCIGLLNKRGDNFLSEELFETPQQIHFACTCHENKEPNISPV